MEPSQKERILLVRSHMGFLEKELRMLDARMDELVAPYKGVISLLCTIPGVDRASAITILSEIGTDMPQFNSSKRLCCWARLTPGSNESAGKKKLIEYRYRFMESYCRFLKFPMPLAVSCSHLATFLYFF